VADSERIAEIRCLSRPEQLQVVRQRLRGVLGDCGCAQELINLIVLAINEAVMNIMQHAYKGKPSGEIVLEIRRVDNELVFLLIDHADPVDVAGIKSRCLDDVRPGGLGVHIINTIMDKVTFLKCPEGTGNQLELRKKMPMPGVGENGTGG